MLGPFTIANQDLQYDFVKFNMTHTCLEAADNRGSRLSALTSLVLILAIGEAGTSDGTRRLVTYLLGKSKLTR